MDSPTKRKTLGEAKIPDRIGIEVLLTNREERCICPKPDVTIKAGDTLAAFGYTNREVDLKNLTSG